MKRHLLSLTIALTAILSVGGIGYYIAYGGDGIGRAARKELKPADFQLLEKKTMSLRKKIEALAPKEYYIVIDTTKNILYLKEGNRNVLEAVVSSGSGNVLEDPSGERRWVFDTPRGEYRIESKKTNPDWIKPDWAFIEEGKPLPESYEERVESGVLGSYALGFGNGYFIHGTLYTKLLGRNVTHGCIRVGDRDLETLYSLVRVGTRVIIF